MIAIPIWLFILMAVLALPFAVAMVICGAIIIIEKICGWKLPRWKGKR